MAIINPSSYIQLPSRAKNFKHIHRNEKLYTGDEEYSV